MLFHPEPDKLPFPTASERGPSLQGTSGGPLLFYGVGLTHCSRSENNNGAFYLPQQGAILVKPPGKLPTPLTIYSSPSDEGALRIKAERAGGGNEMTCYKVHSFLQVFSSVDGGRKGVRRKSTIFSGKEGFTPAGLHACMHGRQGLSQSQSPSSLNQNVRMASPQS
ncbi:hypothetical protein SUGI_1489780 [Cryptomeria japonica]|uniref:Uncharacterized protein n=1 Tax=Cryptomeria japonica TaxID=3369 RepID=A0AAD3NNL3_CRYJA|nr:hypothetical protein SUGI_1489780 [Cryptomeria japonica]